MDTTIEELDKCECVSSIIKIAPVLGIERDKMCPLFQNLGIDRTDAYINTIIDSREDFRALLT